MTGMTHRLNEEEFDKTRRSFLAPFVDGFLIGDGMSRVGVVLFADEPRYVAPLSTYTDKSDLLWRVSELE